MKILGSTKDKIIKDENDGNDIHLEITEVVLVHCKIVTNDYQHISRVLLHLLLINRLVNCYIFHLKMLHF